MNDIDNFKNALQSLTTLKQIDDYGMFQMTYIGDYGFDEFLKVGARDDDEIGAYIMKHLLTDIPINYKSVPGGGCTVFVTRNALDEIIFCRNYDFMYNNLSYSPSLQLFTKPDNGYASVSTVNLMFEGYSEDNLPTQGLYLNSFPTLSSPYMPMDGMNKKGLAIAILAVPEAELQYDESKITLNITTALRLVLDKASTVDEAIELLRQYNMYISMNICCQFLIADVNGDSAIINYYKGELKVTKVDTAYQIASNFIPADGANIGMGANEFERYDTIKAGIENNGGVLSEEQAIDLLCEVGAVFDDKIYLQWSVIYNLTTLKGTIFANRKRDSLIDFQLAL